MRFVRKVKLLLSLSLALSVFTACDNDDDDAKAYDNIFLLSINQVDSTQTENFRNTRTDFVAELLNQEGIINDNAFQGFFAVDPGIDPSNVVVGVTEADSEADWANALGNLVSSASFANYAETFTPLTMVALKPLDGQAFDPSTLTNSGFAVEFAIRKELTPDSFGSLRESFFSMLPEYDGFQFDREFEVYDIQENGSLIKREGYQAVMIVWDSPTNFFSAANLLFAEPAFANFSQSIETEYYFVTQPTN